jgi:hypothetical protein
MATDKWPSLSGTLTTPTKQPNTSNWASMTGKGKAVAKQKEATQKATAAAKATATAAKTAAEASEKEELLKVFKRELRAKNIIFLVPTNQTVTVDVSPRITLGGTRACFNYTVGHALTVNISATGPDELNRLAEQRLKMLDLDEEDFSTAVTMLKQGLLDFGLLNTLVDLTRTTPKRVDEKPLYEQLKELGVTEFLENYKRVVLERSQDVLDVLMGKKSNGFLLPIQQIIALF